LVLRGIWLASVPTGGGALRWIVMPNRRLAREGGNNIEGDGHETTS